MRGMRDATFLGPRGKLAELQELSASRTATHAGQTAGRPSGLTCPSPASVGRPYSQRSSSSHSSHFQLCPAIPPSPEWVSQGSRSPVSHPCPEPAESEDDVRWTENGTSPLLMLPLFGGVARIRATWSWLRSPELPHLLLPPAQGLQGPWAPLAEKRGDEGRPPGRSGDLAPGVRILLQPPQSDDQ